MARAFFATRTKPMADDERGFRYWRYVELEDGLQERELGREWRSFRPSERGAR